MVKTFRLPEFGYEVEIGKFAQQADGAVWLRQGGTVVLATVVSAPTQDFPGFLPLTIDYRELFSAAGKIPGGYFKREGKPTDREVLTGRLIDRAIRPLFPTRYFNQLQILTTVYSVDKEHTPQTLGLIATSLALSISKIPFLGPVGVVEIGRLNGKWIINPLYEEGMQSDVRLVIAGTEEGICMVEGSSVEISEKEFIDALFLAHEKIKEQVAWQKEVQKEVGAAKEIETDRYSWSNWQERVDTFLNDEKIKSLYVADKVQRNENLNAAREAFIEQYKEEITASKEAAMLPRVINYIFDRSMEVKITEVIFNLHKRIDGRAYDQVRPISIEVGLLPYNHGSALFTRGRTQALVSVTLGGGQDEQKIENIQEGEANFGAFMLHYNFLPFSVGEVRPYRGPGRREVGHGYLAASALRRMIPDRADFPYTIRIVADILESDGSTSMATTCGSTMALMQAGVPIKKMVSGIAMGLLKNLKGDFTVLSDISGFEDAFGLMDFKVTGTEDGITAIQMDIKYKGGLTREIFEAALAQAKTGRLHILNEMKKVMSHPNATMSDLVPKLVTIKINTDKIGAVIGTGGKVIREIVEKTGTTIDIEPDGLVKIFGATGANMDKAINWVKTLAGQIEPGTVYHGKIKRLADFGIFVELVPGLDGLVHISNIPRDKQRTFLRDFKIDDDATVQVIEYEESTGRVRLRLLEQ
ncbi:polyribonucleotide nucleotidyltransferase [Candidatus Dependentiae bacterium Noda2021]|nr:polyribonucleotide nucleotidyltransferase [Candidatus Dependentiae bacterium Noda2021]